MISFSVIIENNQTGGTSLIFQVGRNQKFQNSVLSTTKYFNENDLKPNMVKCPECKKEFSYPEMDFRNRKDHIFLQ